MIMVQDSAVAPSATAESYQDDGAPLTFADRIAMVERMLRSCPELSDRGVAAKTGLSTGTVAAVRVRTGTPAAARIGRDGRVRPVSCADGREAAARYLARYPKATLREVARAVGISLGTARDVRTRLRRGEEIVPARGRADRKPGRVARAAPASDSRAALAVLRRDPSLRGAQTGRQLLRLLDAHAALGDLRQLSEALPAHCVDLVAGLAAECADGWARLATQLDRRQRATGT
ncbi:streptomycin biosynthesis regulator [Saccharothrix longispora]|uniref:streptomycin biosynthesis regulator n=1 Tax=Saccharothrix longispora TaxID=33920 RepID=UPI0028FD79C5|nr:streptomycin biosynthesis regulator [Saccharothrix longispora]MDU0292371.1 streptomycin biosynthesis regulator [Saccharothrix longispora]